MIQQAALAQLDKSALKSKKFVALLVGAALMTAVGLFAFERGVAKEAVEAVLYPLLLLFSGYVGTTAWQDRAVRLAGVMQGSAQEPPKP